MAEFPLSSMELMSTDQAAAAMGCSRNTILTVCKNNPGFGFRFARSFRIPRTNIERVIAGERPADIAASVRSSGAIRAA
jgi:hypothetical protein